MIRLAITAAFDLIAATLPLGSGGYELPARFQNYIDASDHKVVIT